MEKKTPEQWEKLIKQAIERDDYFSYQIIKTRLENEGYILKINDEVKNNKGDNNDI